MSLGTLQIHYFYQSDNNSNADDAGDADLRGFCVICGCYNHAEGEKKPRRLRRPRCYCRFGMERGIMNFLSE